MTLSTLVPGNSRMWKSRIQNWNHIRIWKASGGGWENWRSFDAGTQTTRPSPWATSRLVALATTSKPKGDSR